MLSSGEIEQSFPSTRSRVHREPNPGATTDALPRGRLPPPCPSSITSRSSTSAPAPDAFIVALRPEQRTAALLLGKQLRAAGLRVENDLRGQSLKSQMRRSDSLGSRFALVLGESEVAAGTVQVKDLRASTQTELPAGEVAAAIKAALQ